MNIMAFERKVKCVNYCKHIRSTSDLAIILLFSFRAKIKTRCKGGFSPRHTLLINKYTTEKRIKKLEHNSALNSVWVLLVFKLDNC